MSHSVCFQAISSVVELGSHIFSDEDHNQLSKMLKKYENGPPEKVDPLGGIDLVIKIMEAFKMKGIADYDELTAICKQYLSDAMTSDITKEKLVTNIINMIGVFGKIKFEKVWSICSHSYQRDTFCIRASEILSNEELEYVRNHPICDTINQCGEGRATYGTNYAVEIPNQFIELFGILIKYNYTIKGKRRAKEEKFILMVLELKYKTVVNEQMFSQ